MKSLVLATLAILCLLAVPAPRVVRAAEDIMNMVAGAKTAADHEALARYYDHEAETAKGKADEHRKMAAEYRKMGGPAVKAQLPEHCDGLAVQYEGAAKEYAALAKFHRDFAKSAK